MKYLFGLLFLFLTTLSLAIDNDDCASATVIAVGTSCNSQFFATLDAITSGDASPSCGFYQGGDAWYAFTVPASGGFRIQVDDAGEGNHIIRCTQEPVVPYQKLYALLAPRTGLTQL